MALLALLEYLRVAQIDQISCFGTNDVAGSNPVTQTNFKSKESLNN